MDLPRYSYLTNDFLNYEFYSNGPNGRVKKMATFGLIQDEPPIYNLSLVDINADDVKSDLSVSDNGDRDIILATVAYSVVDFCTRYGNHFVFAKGSTAVRTRLYQIAISKSIEEISTEFDVFGVLGDIAYPFQRNVNYEAFLVKKK